MGIDESLHGLACVIYATAPMMRASDLVKAHEVLINQPQINYAYSVGPDQVTDAGQFYFGRVQAFLNSEPLTGKKVRKVPLPANRVCDINTLDDWKKAERMYAKLQEKPPQSLMPYCKDCKTQDYVELVGSDFVGREFHCKKCNEYWSKAV